MFSRNKIFKKTMAIIVSCVMFMGVAPFQAFAAPTSLYIKTGAVSNITENSAIIAGTVSIDNSEGIISTRGIAYSTVPLSLDTLPSNATFAESGSNDFMIELKDLSPKTKYYARTYVRYTDATTEGNPIITDYGDQVTFDTSAKLTDITINPVTSTTTSGLTSATFRASFIPDDNYTINSVSFVYVKNSSALPTKDNNRTTAVWDSSTQFSLTLSNLDQNSSYYVRACVEAAYGGNTYFFYSDNVYKYDTTAVVTKTAPKVTTSNVTFNDTTVTASGLITNDGNDASNLKRGFVYSTTTNPPVVKSSTCTQLDVNTTNNSFSKSFTVTKGVTYYVRAFATNNIDTTYGATTYTIYVPTVTTAEPTLSGTSISVVVTITNYGPESIKTKGFVYSTSNITPTISNSKATSTNTASSFTTTLTGATAGAKYYVRAFATTDNGNTSYGAVKSITVPSSTSKPTVTTGTVTRSGSTITAKGTITNSGSSSITERGFLYSTTNSSPTISGSNVSKASGGSSTSLSASISASSGTTYYVRAYAVNSYGEGYGSVVTLSGSLPTVVTDSITNIAMNSADVYIDVTSTGGYSITKRGFVYSSYSTTPTLNTSNTSSKTISGTTGKDYETITGLDSNTKYYVCAYATNSQGTAYGEVKNFTTTDNASIRTEEVVDITGGGATFIGYITDVTGTITEKGFAYGTSSSPTISSSTVSSTAKTTGRYSLDIDDLSPSTKYYVRAYVTTSKGTSYGTSLSFTTTDSASARTTAATSITEASATLNGSASNPSGYSITEKGFVYSRTNSTPTLSDSKAVHSSTSTGTYSINLTGLASDTSYYYRAYVKTSQGTTYGTVATFTTKDSTTVITVNFKTIYGDQVKAQKITASSGNTLDESYLSAPSGYELYDSSWKYTVSGTASVTVLVSKIESAFMKGVGNYRFAPDQETTRAEVAQSIYNLATDKTIPSGAKSFTDVSKNHTAQKAIEYCSAKGYMNGFPDGSFRPNDNITRVQMSVVLCKVYNLTGSATSSFPDVKPSYWGYNYISLVNANNMMSGYKSGLFGFDNTTTRAEVCTLFSNAEKRGLEPLGQIDFIDVSTEHWAYKYIMNAAISE